MEGFAFHNSAGEERYARHLPHAAPRGTLVIVHGYAEHSGRYLHVAESAQEAGCAVWAYDQYAHGQSPGPRGKLRDFDVLPADLGAFCAHVRERSPGPYYVLGHSMGGLVTLRALQTGRIAPDGLVLSSPFIAPNEEVPAFLNALAPFVAAALPFLPVFRLGLEKLSRDPHVVEAARVDPLYCMRPIDAGTGYALQSAIAACQRAFSEVRVPLLAMHGTADQLAPVSGTQRLEAEAAAADKTVRYFEGGYHELFNDTDREEVFAVFRSWLAPRLRA